MRFATLMLAAVALACGAWFIFGWVGVGWFVFGWFTLAFLGDAAMELYDAWRDGRDDAEMRRRREDEQVPRDNGGAIGPLA